ncbi:MAG: hypothetical protein ACLUB0_12810 [Blautia hansenii]
MESLWSVLSIVIQFSGVFGIFYVIRGMYMFRKKKFPTAGFDETQKEENRAWCRGEGTVCLYWGVLLLLLNVCICCGVDNRAAFYGCSHGVVLLFCAGCGGRIRTI